MKFSGFTQTDIHSLSEVREPTKNDRILVFSPHPDDETIATGGYIAASSGAGGSVWVILVTDGNKRGLERQRCREFKRATAILGVPEENLFFLDYPDGALKRQNLQKLHSQFEKIIQRLQPNIILASHPEDRHQEHIIVGKTVADVIGDRKIDLYQYLIRYPRFPFPKKFAPKHYLLPPISMVDLDGEWRKFMLQPEIEELKRKAVLQYRTQLHIPIVRGRLLGLIRQNELFVVPQPREN